MMLKLVFVLFLTFAVCYVHGDYDSDVIFTVYSGFSSFVWKSGTTLTTQGCDASGKFTLISHGWQGSKSAWIMKLVQKFLQYRGGCVVFMNWGIYSDSLDYNKVINTDWSQVSAVLLKRLQGLIKEGVSPDNMVLYGHSLGARLVQDVGMNLGNQLISQIYACDPAGPGFYFWDFRKPIKSAAKLVQCINTSWLVGTTSRNCHENWIMGNCGNSQPAANLPRYLECLLPICSSTNTGDISHLLCNDFFINSFENNFTANNYYNCSSILAPSTLPTGFKMGYMETRHSPSTYGVIPSPTSKNPPYAGI